MSLDRFLDACRSREGQPAGVGGHSCRPGRDVAGERPAIGISDEIQHPVAPIAGAARCHDLHESAQTSLGVLFSEAGDLCIERRLSLTLDEISTRPIYE